MSDENSDANEEEFWHEHQEEVLAEINEEERDARPVRRFISGVRFFSRSKGRGRSRRKHPREVTLLQYGEDRNAGRWRLWSGEDRTDEGRNPWDEWATEVFGSDFCDQLSEAGIHPDDYLRAQVIQLLQECGGKF